MQVGPSSEECLEQKASTRVISCAVPIEIPFGPADSFAAKLCDFPLLYLPTRSHVALAKHETYTLTKP